MPAPASRGSLTGVSRDIMKFPLEIPLYRVTWELCSRPVTPPWPNSPGSLFLLTCVDSGQAPQELDKRYTLQVSNLNKREKKDAFPKDMKL